MKGSNNPKAVSNPARRNGRSINIGIAVLVGLVFGNELFDDTQFDVSALWLLLVLGAGLIVLCISIASIERNPRKAGIGITAAIVALAWLVLSLAPGGDRIISRIQATDGTEMCMLQQANGYWAEPYSLTFCYRKPGKMWKRMYFDHQDLRWWFGSISLDRTGNRAVVRRFILPVAYFDIAAEQFTIVRRGSTGDGYSAAAPPTWTPEGALQR